MKQKNAHTHSKAASSAGRAKKWFFQAYAVAVATFLMPMTANAAISDWFENIEKEFVAIIPIIVFILGAIGIVLAGFGIISAIMAKKNRQPMEYQHWMIIGGVMCVLLIPFVLALGESISGDSISDNVDFATGALEYIFTKNTTA